MLCDQAKAILIEEWNVQLVKCPVTVNEPTSSSSFLSVIGVLLSMNEPRLSYLGVMFQIWTPTKQIVELGVGLVTQDGFMSEFGPSTIWIWMFMIEVDQFLSLVGG